MARRVLTAFMCLGLWSPLTLPAAAQDASSGSIAGVVRDEAGAVLPGVTVEASSPALIERTRTVVTDGEGRYRLVDLRPGTYAVTFTLAGFRAVRREGYRADHRVHRHRQCRARRRRDRRNDHRHRRRADRRRAGHAAAAGVLARNGAYAADRQERRHLRRAHSGRRAAESDAAGCRRHQGRGHPVVPDAQQRPKHPAARRHVHGAADGRGQLQFGGEPRDDRGGRGAAHRHADGGGAG